MSRSLAPPADSSNSSDDSEDDTGSKSRYGDPHDVVTEKTGWPVRRSAGGRYVGEVKRFEKLRFRRVRFVIDVVRSKRDVKGEEADVGGDLRIRIRSNGEIRRGVGFDTGVNS